VWDRLLFFSITAREHDVAGHRAEPAASTGGENNETGEGSVLEM